jgi:hypothetical protein
LNYQAVAMFYKITGWSFLFGASALIFANSVIADSKNNIPLPMLNAESISGTNLPDSVATQLDKCPI